MAQHYFLFAVYVQDNKKKSSSIVDTIDPSMVICVLLFILDTFIP